MMDKPILFSGEMARAILEGKKTQTRRVINPQIEWNEGIFQRRKTGTIDQFTYVEFLRRCPYGKIGDSLWVRETWRAEELNDGLDGIRYKADGLFIPIKNTEEASDAWCAANMNKQLWEKDLWKPSIFMPRWASRINLEITGVRVERVQEIDRADAKAEGVSNLWSWDEINGQRGFGWDVNPWVWVVEFKRVEVRDVV